ncbi:precorrin-3B synthase [Amycolatopsis vancoresmycina DSM 44592]|uniref:Precorrin-3B synthase n=1 Tax=Amycolatopsis vancoresmycina DSM 44592 TaxID=1292037 RepID=R1GCI9_9PSEU|nr:precorrin-3B synthase [Amycolatopsis vancoresmycina DSM 44592]
MRLPGGTISAAQLHALADAAEACGDGDLHLTSRGNVQLRGVTRPSLAARLADAGLLPSPSHERVRNVLASPLSGVRGGLADVRGLAGALDFALCSAPELAALPGRFLFAFDDGRGDVAGEGADVCWRALDSGTGTLLLAGGDTGRRVARADAVAALIEVALEFCRIRGSAWRVAELDDPAWRRTPVPRVEVSVPVGLIERDGGFAAGVVPRFGQLSAAQARALAEFGTALVTPWKTVVLPDVPADVFERLGFGGEALGTTACIGRPGCAKSRADVRADAVFRPGLRAHFSGCERRCGKPSRSHVDVVAEAGGYRIDGRWVPLDELKGNL